MSQLETNDFTESNFVQNQRLNEIAKEVNNLTSECSPFGNRFRINNRKFTAVADKKYCFSRYVTKAPSFSGSKLHLVFTNWFVESSGTLSNVETNNDNELIIERVAVWIKGISYIASWEKQQSKTLAVGETVVFTVECNVPSGGNVFIDVASSVNDGAQTLGSVMRSTRIGDVAAYSNSSFADIVGVSVPVDNASSNRTNQWYPLTASCIFMSGISTNKPPCPLVTGDSIAVGSSDFVNGYTVNGAFGYIDRAFSSKGVPTLNFAVSGSRPSQASNPATFNKRFNIVSMIQDLTGKLPFEYVLDEYIVNDMGGSAVTVSELISYKTSFVSMIKTQYNLPVYSTTNTPRTSGANTFDYSSADTQTVGAGNGINDSRWLYYNNLKSDYFNMGIHAVVDVSEICTDQTNRDKWITGLGYQGNLTTAASANSTSVLKLSRTSVGKQPVAGDVLILSAGTSTPEAVIVKSCTVDSSSVYSVTFENRNGFNVTTLSHALDASVKWAPVSDGLHPSSSLHQIMAVRLLEGLSEVGLF